jgi:uncharacterized delta-60 repeat protein
MRSSLPFACLLACTCACGSVQETPEGEDGLFTLAAQGRAMVRQGDMISIEVTVAREEGFDQEVIITADDLPPDVSGAELTIPADQTNGILVIQAAEAAAQGDAAIKIVGSAGELERTAELRLLVAGQPGTLDLSFGDEGVVAIPPDEKDPAAATGETIVVQPDGSILVAGSLGPDALLLKLMPDGALDTDFGDGGMVLPGPGAIHALLLLAGGGIALGGGIGAPGGFDPAVYLYGEDGEPEPGFGDGGVALVAPGELNAEIHDLLLGPDGILYGVGFSTDPLAAYLVRILGDGSGADPIAFLEGARFQDATLLPDGKLLVAGCADGSFWLGQFEPSGALDSSFGEQGVAVVEFMAEAGPLTAEATAVDLVDGNILLTGTAGESISLASLLASGQVNMDYAVNGQIVIDLGVVPKQPGSTTLLPDGGLLISGAALSGNEFVLANLLASGDLNEDFANGGVLETELGLGTNRYSGARGHTIDPDGRILVTGRLADNLVVIRLWP